MILDIVPATSEFEDRLANRMGSIRAKLKATVIHLTEAPPTDVLVNLKICTNRDADIYGADAIVYMETTPKDVPRADIVTLCATIAQDLHELGLDDKRGIEVWPRYIPGVWCMIRNGVIVDHTFNNE